MAVERIVSFVNELEKLKDTWASMETKVLAGKVEDRWVNLGTIIRLSSEESEEEEKELFRLQNRIIILQKREKFNFENFRTILTNPNRTIEIRNIEITSEGFRDFDYLRKEKENWTQDRITGIEPAYLIHSYGRGPLDLLNIKSFEEIDRALQANIEPYENISDLSSRYLFVIDGAYSSAIYIVAPIYIKFEEIRLSTSGKLEFSIKCHKSIEVENLKMNVILSSASANVDRFQLSFERKALAEGDFFVIDELVERNLAGIKGARIYLFYKDELMRRDWINAISPYSEEELRNDIISVVQRMRESVSNIEKALEEIDVAILNGIIDIEDNVKDKSIWNDLGMYCIENGFYRQAELIYGAMIDTITKYEKSKGKRIHKGLAFHNLGVALLYQNRREEAKEMFKQAYEEDKLSYGIVNAERMPAREALRKFFN